MQQFYTTETIAEIVNVLPSSVRRKKGLDRYLEGYSANDGPGRKAKLYKPSVVELWGLNPSELSQPASDSALSSRRADFRKPRGKYAEHVDMAVKTAKSYFLSAPTMNLQEACRITETMAAMDGVEICWKYLYKRLKRNITDTGGYRSPYFEENWEAIYKSRKRVKETALESFLSNRYNHFSMYRKAGLLGKGYGSRRVIVVDDFKRDVWVEGADGQMTMPWGLLFVDGITGFPLMIVPCESITTDVVAAGILMTVFSHGIHPDTIWVFETARAMKNDNIVGLIESLYTPAELEAFKYDKDGPAQMLFDGQHGPFVTAPPMIARSVFKSKVERSIKLFKDEFDGLYFANSYQGGDRKEGVQLTLAGSPYDILKLEKPGQDNEDMTKRYSERLFPMNAFWVRFSNWVWGKFIDVKRPKMYPLFAREFGESKMVSIREVHDYFTSDNDGSFIPDVTDFNRIGMLLYYAQPARHKFTVKMTQIGGYQTTLNNRSLQIFCDDLRPGDVGKRVCTIPIPGEADRFIIVDVTDSSRPELLGIGKDVFASSFAEAKDNRRDIREYRQETIKELQQEADEYTIEIADDAFYQATPPTADLWTRQLAAKASGTFAELDGHTDDETDNSSEIYEELKPRTAKGKAGMKELEELQKRFL